MVSRLYEFKTKLVRSLAAREPISFFGMQFKPGAARKSKRKDSDRLKAIYNQVHDFSLLDPAVQVNNLKNHLIAVGRQRRSNFQPPTL